MQIGIIFQKAKRYFFGTPRGTDITCPFFYYYHDSTPNNRYNVRGASGRFTSRSGGNSRSSSLDNVSQDGDGAEEYEDRIASSSINLIESPSIRGEAGSFATVATTDNDNVIKAVKGTHLGTNEAGVTDDENIDQDDMLEENEDMEDEDPDWSGVASEDEDDGDLDDPDDPEWGPADDDQKFEGEDI